MNCMNSVSVTVYLKIEDHFINFKRKEISANKKWSPCF